MSSFWKEKLAFYTLIFATIILESMMKLVHDNPLIFGDWQIILTQLSEIPEIWFRSYCCTKIFCAQIFIRHRWLVYWCVSIILQSSSLFSGVNKLLSRVKLWNHSFQVCQGCYVRGLPSGIYSYLTLREKLGLWAITVKNNTYLLFWKTSFWVLLAFLNPPSKWTLGCSSSPL